jgi:YVTN family beta-propeller protein
MTCMGLHRRREAPRRVGEPSLRRGRGPWLAFARAVPAAVVLTCACLSRPAPAHDRAIFVAEPFRPQSTYALIRDPTGVGRQSQASLPTNVSETAVARAAGGVANSGVQTVYMGKNPVAVAVDGRTGRAFVVVQGGYDLHGNPTGNGSVRVVDTRHGRVLRTVGVGLSPSVVAVDERTGRVFVANDGERSVSVLDASSGTVLRTVRVGFGPIAMATDERDGRVLVANEGVTDSAGHPLGDGSVSMLDAHSGKVLGTVVVGMSPSAIAVDQQRGRAYVLNRVSANGGVVNGSLSVLDVRRVKLVATITLRGSPRAIALDARTGRVFVVSETASIAGTMSPARVTLLDPGHGHASRTTTIGGFPQGIAVADRAGRVFVAGGGDGTSVSVLDARTGGLVHTVPTGTYPGIVAVDNGRGRAFVAMGGTTGNRVLVLDARTGKVGRPIPIRGEIVKAMVVDERTGRAFVVSASPAGDGWLSTLGAAP